MGLVKEQIQERIKQESELYTNALFDIANVVMAQKGHRIYKESDNPAQKALAQLMEYYHIPQDTMIKDINLDFILNYICNTGHKMKRYVKLKSTWYKDGSGVLLALNQRQELIVLFPYVYGGYYVIDGVSKKKQRIHKKNATEYREAYCFYDCLPERSCTKRDLMHFMVKQITYFDIGKFFFVLIISMLIGMVTPSVNAYLFSNILDDKLYGILLLCILLLCCMSIANVFIDAIKIFLCAKLDTKIANACEAALMIRLLHLPSSFYRMHAAGELSGCMQYIQRLSEVIVSICASSIMTTCFSFVYIIQISTYAPVLVSVSCFFFILMILFIILGIFTQVHMIRKCLVGENHETDFLYTVLAGIQKIKNAGAEKRAFAKWANTYKQHAKARYDPNLFVKIIPVILSIVQFISLISIYYIAYKQKVTVANFIAFQTAYAMMSAALLNFNSAVSTIANVIVTLEFVEPILKSPCEVQGHQTMVTKITGNIEFNHVFFRYEEHRPYLLNDITLKIKAGEYIAIVGETGCGKSTCIRLLLGFETPQQGAIYFDGKDMSHLHTGSLRNTFGVVLQDGKLFQGDIFSNIALCAPTLTLQEAWDIVDLVGMREDIEHMPMKMLTLLSEGGGGLSQGQQQRLLIARAIAPKPKLLIFDEATSALDNITQKQVSMTLDALKCTRIVIAHRLSTIQHCDRILVLEKGIFVEEGTYQELLQKKGIFAKLVRRQQLHTLEGDQYGNFASS